MKRRFTPWLFLFPSLIGVLLFIALPFFDVIKRSFMDAMGNRFVGLENYRAVLGNSAFRLAAGNTARFMAVCIPLLMLTSFITALLISFWADQNGKSADTKRNIPCRTKSDSVPKEQGRLFRTTLVLPMAIPDASMVLVWKILFCPEGVLNQWLSAVSGQSWNTDWAFSSRAFFILTATYLWKHMGYDMILWLSALQGIPHELYEAAQMDGAGTAAKLWYITLPELKGSFSLVGILSIVNAFRVYREAYLLAGAYPDSSIYLLPHLFAHWFLRLDIQKITAAAVLLTGILLIPAPGLLFSHLRKKWITCQKSTANIQENT